MTVFLYILGAIMLVAVFTCFLLGTYFLAKARTDEAEERERISEASEARAAAKVVDR